MMIHLRDVDEMTTVLTTTRRHFEKQGRTIETRDIGQTSHAGTVRNNVKLAQPDLGSCAARRESSSLSFPTTAL